MSVLARAFDAVFRPWMRTRFAAIVVRGEPRPPPHRPVLLVANHVSWWDGFLLREVHRTMRRDAPFFAVMLAHELARHPFLRRLGALPLEPGSLASLRALLRRLRRERARHAGLTVAYFPQGRLWPSQRRPLGFRRGVSAVAGALAPAAIVPVALHIEPHTRPAPVAYVLLGAPIDTAQAPDARTLERAVEALLDALIETLTTSNAPEHA